jgi:hypothetical protein
MYPAADGWGGKRIHIAFIVIGQVHEQAHGR